ncbi:MAG: peptidase BlaR1 [Bryobacterales bacterium]|nr:peptidase BlaR1 [Bryobacterales bacterium]
MRVHLLLIVPAAVILGQSVDYPRRYKVAVVTPNTESNARPALVSIPPSPLVLRAFTLQELIARAYGAPSFQVIRGPEWVDTNRWNFRLETEPVIMPTEQHRQVLLRALEDRFQLRAHRENKVMPVYELAVTGTVSKLRPDPFLDARGPMIRSGIGSIHRRNTSVDEFAKLLSLHLGRPVLDKTDLPGLFAFSLDWLPAPGENGAPEATGFAPTNAMATRNTAAPSIFQALQEQLGLRLTPSHGPVEVIVIDKAEKPRTD